MPKVKKSFRTKLETTLKTIKSETIHIGFSHIDIWADLGNLALNRMMSGRFDRGFLFGRNYVIYGESGSGKSLEAAYIAGNCQRDHGAYVLWIDVEKATDDDAGKKWLSNAGVDLDALSYTTVATLGDVKAEIAKATKLARQFRDDEEEYPPLVVVVDSWAAAMTQNQWDAALDGIQKGDQGQKAKQTGDVILATTHLCHNLPVLVIGIQHVMDNQEKHPQTGRVIGRKHKTTGGNKQVFFASGCLLLTKRELREEDLEDQEAANHYKKLSDGMTADLKKRKRTVGISAVAESLKSRVSKPFERVNIQIPYVTGMDRYSGLFEWLMLEGTVITTSPGWYAYLNKEGEQVKFQKAKFTQHRDAILAGAPADISDKEDDEDADTTGTDGSESQESSSGLSEGTGADA